MYKDLTVRCANRLISGGQIVNISSVSKSGVADVMTAAWNTPYDSDQVLVVLDQGHTTTANIIETQKFVLSIPTEDQIALINKVGSAHGRDTGDKFEYAGVKADISEKLGLKVLPDAMAYIECELTDLETLKKTGVCIGKAVSIKVREDLWNSSDDSFGEGFKKTLHYISENKYYVDGRIVEVSL